jgi:hypothetical protein
MQQRQFQQQQMQQQQQQMQMQQMQGVGGGAGQFTGESTTATSAGPPPLRTSAAATAAAAAAASAAASASSAGGGMGFVMANGAPVLLRGGPYLNPHDAASAGGGWVGMVRRRKKRERSFPHFFSSFFRLDFQNSLILLNIFSPPFNSPARPPETSCSAAATTLRPPRRPP